MKLTLGLLKNCSLKVGELGDKSGVFYKMEATIFLKMIKLKKIILGWSTNCSSKVAKMGALK